MKNIPLANIPVQSFSIRLDDNYYDITLRLCAASSRREPFYSGASYAMDVIRDQVPIVLGQNVVTGSPVIPYFYLETGNFIWITEDGELLDYNQFGISQFLIYASPAELAVIYASP